MALVGTFLLNVVGYLPIEESTSTSALLVASGVVVLGTLLTIWSLATLGRCFGLFPEVRGLVLRGPYRLVRHPVYLGELVSAVGLLLARPHPWCSRCSRCSSVLQYWPDGVRGARAGRRVPERVPGVRAARAATGPRLTRDRARSIGGILPRQIAHSRQRARGGSWGDGRPVEGNHGAGWAVAVLHRRGRWSRCAACRTCSRRSSARPTCARMGTFWFDRDFSQYAAAMREGARQSGWLIHDHFSAEPHAAALMYPLYVGYGQSRRAARR